VALRHIAPLTAALVLFGPGVARAAAPSPDAAPAVSPDPVPKPAPRVVKPVVHVIAPRRFVEIASPPAPAVPVRTARPVKKPARPQHRTPLAHPVRVVDVFPLRVDVHRGVESIASQVRDDKLLALAGAALLAAVTAAASGAALTLFARRRPV
jgi:hypothetical protein